MKAEISNIGALVIIDESITDEYALDKWISVNMNPCSKEVLLIRDVFQFREYKESEPVTTFNKDGTITIRFNNK